MEHGEVLLTVIVPSRSFRSYYYCVLMLITDCRVGSRSRLFGAWNGCSQMTMVKVTRQSETSTPGSPEDGETIRKRGSSQSNRPHPVSRARRATRQHHPTQRPQRARKKDGISLDGPDDAQRKNQKRSKSASGRKSVPSAGRKKAASLRAQSPASSKESKRPASRRDGKRGDEKRKGTGGSRKEEGHPGAESADGRGKDLGEAGGAEPVSRRQERRGPAGA